MDLIRATRQAIERRMSITDFDSVLDMLAGGGAPSYTGKMVSPRNALSIDACWACVLGKANDFATCPLPVYRWTEPGEAREEARDHYLWRLLMQQANPRMSAWRFKWTMEAWRQLWGNCYAELELNGRGQVTALWPWRPDRVKVWPEDPDDVRSRLFYTYFPVNRSYKPVTLSESQMLHVRGVSLDGIVGLSPVEVHRQTLGINMAMTEHEGRFYSNGMTPKGVLTHPGKLGDKGLISLRESMTQYQGLSNAHRLMILEEGMKFQDIGMKLEDAQFMEAMNYNDQKIARIYNFPQHRIGLLERATNNNIEHLAIEYIQYSLGPDEANWCGELHDATLSPRDRDTIFCEPDYTYLLMADHTSRAAYFRELGNQGALSPDDMRHVEGWNPLPGGIGRTPRVNGASIPLDSELAKNPGTAPLAREAIRGRRRAAQQ